MSATSKLSPVAVCCNFSYNQIQTRNNHTCAITTGGTAWCWGRSTEGQLGNNQALADQSTPSAVCGGHTFCKISVGQEYSCGVRNDGIIYCWGINTSGQLGDNTTTNRSTPVAVCGGISFCEVTCGADSTLARDANGLLYGWGSNLGGRLGILNWVSTSPNLISSI